MLYVCDLLCVVMGCGSVASARPILGYKSTLQDLISWPAVFCMNPRGFVFMVLEMK